MAAKFAQIDKQIWADPEWVALTPTQQWLYLHLISHPELTWAGVVGWDPEEVSILAAGVSPEEVEAAGDVLQARGFIVFDERQRRVLIRTFHRNQEGMMAQPNMGAAVATAFAKLLSPRLRGVLSHELRRLQAERPEWRSWASLAPVLVADPVDPVQFRAEPVGVPDMPPLEVVGVNEPPF